MFTNHSSLQDLSILSPVKHKHKKQRDSNDTGQVIIGL